MRYHLTAFLLAFSSLGFAQTLTPPKAETDPQNVIAKMNPNLSAYSLDKFFATREIYVKDLLAHKEYDRKEWKKWC